MKKPLQTLAKLAEAVGIDYSAINSDDMIIQTAEAALKEIKRLTKELTKETVRKEAAYTNEQRLENDNLELRRRIFARFNEDECWIFQDDGHDYPESLVCPVVMSAGKLRELVEARSERDEMAALGVIKAQCKVMMFDPATGKEKPFPSHASQWRQWHGQNTAWLFNPWTGARRSAGDIGSDTTGLLITPKNDTGVR